MALQKQKIEIVIESLAQKTSKLAKPPGKLASCTNCEFDKTGILNKSRGFAEVSIVTMFDPSPGVTANLQYFNAGTFRDELLLYGDGALIAFALKFQNAQALTSVTRGPLPRGNCAKRKIVVAAVGNVLPPPPED
jgi:hypothetical protein